jgi:flagellin
MSRINTNVTSLIAQRVLNKNQTNQNQSLQRLSTGLKINSGSDDPAGLIAAKNLEAEQAGINAALTNASRAGNIVGTAEGGLNEVSSLLTQLQGLVGQSSSTGGLSKEETSANQLQVDSILTTINRVSGATNFQGIHLLNGNLDYTTSSVDATKIANLRVNAAQTPDASKIAVNVAVAASAATGQVVYSGTVGTGGVTLQVSGTKGSQQLSFASGATVTDVGAAINAVKDATGLSATVSGTALKVNTTTLGSKSFVSLKAAGGNNNGTTVVPVNNGYGKDAVVAINGATATADGANISFRSSTLDLEFTLKANFGSTPSTFGITGGGATFQFGSKVTENGKATIGIQAVTTANLGNGTNSLSDLTSGGTLSLNSGNFVKAQDVITSAIKQVSTLRGRLGAFQKFTVGSTVNNLNVALENSSSALSTIQDTDFASETANLTRSQILSQAATTVLSQANSAPQSVLTLLRG